MQKNANKKEMGERLGQLRKGRKVEDYFGKKCKTMEQLLELLNSEDINCYEYSKPDIILPYDKSCVFKIESGEILPSTDYLYLVHKVFNKSVDYLAVGHTLPEIEEFQRIYKRLDKYKQNSLEDRCIDLLKKEPERDRDYECDDIFIDYRVRMYEVRKYFCEHYPQGKLTQAQFSKLVGFSVNTMDKYHSIKNDVYSEDYVKIRNSALEYLINFSTITGASIDYILYGTYFDENYPVGLSEELHCYNYEKQIKILKLWLEEAKKFEKNQE